jgi:DNA-binding response OmpR family regulator
VVHAPGGERVNVLVIDDDRELCSLLELTFRRSGLTAASANDAIAGLRLFRAEPPDVVVLDVNLGGEDGFDVLREIRRAGHVPVLMLTARDAEDDRVAGLDLGADDYVTKPFSHRELVARVRAQMRRTGHDIPDQRNEPVMRVGPLTLDVRQHVALRDGARLDLTVTEFRLLHALMREAGAVVPARRLLKQVWGYDDPASTDVVRVTVHRLRRKLGDDPAQPRLIHTIAGVGVMLSDGADTPDASPVA